MFLPQTEALMTSGRAGDQLKLSVLGASDRFHDLDTKGKNIHQSKKTVRITYLSLRGKKQKPRYSKENPTFGGSVNGSHTLKFRGKTTLHPEYTERQKVFFMPKGSRLFPSQLNRTLKRSLRSTIQQWRTALRVWHE